MKSLAAILLFSIPLLISAQKPNAEAIMKEGKLLYQLEKAAWLASDHLLENYPELQYQIGGYVSYPTQDSMITVAFFHYETTKLILIRYQISSNLNIKNLSASLVKEEASSQEKNLITIRQDALNQLNENKDHFFMHHEGTSFNLIPVSNEKNQLVYILTASQTSGEVLLGNDYQLEYDQQNELVEVYKLHHSMIRLPFSAPDQQEITATMHTHVIASHIEPTDVCTLLLYRDFVTWKQHYVIHSNFVSILDLETEKLSIITRKAFDKMSKK